MSGRGNRIGTVSSVDTETGMVSVFYNDQIEATGLLPYVTFNDEYKPPQIGAKVVVLPLSNGGSVVLGTYWNRNNSPEGNGSYRKDFGGAYVNYKDDMLTISAENIRFLLQGEKKEVAVMGILEDIENIKRKIGME